MKSLNLSPIPTQSIRQEDDSQQKKPKQFNSGESLRREDMKLKKEDNTTEKKSNVKKIKIDPKMH